MIIDAQLLHRLPADSVAAAVADALAKDELGQGAVPVEQEHLSSEALGQGH